MARLETKVLETSPAEEQSKIELMEKFGWSVLGRQEIYNRDSHLEDRSDGLYSVTETTNYVKVTFQRDKDMPNYENLKNLESEYNSLLTNKPYADTHNALRNIGLVLAVLGIPQLVSAEVVQVLIGAAMIALGGFLFVTKVKKNKKIKEETSVQLNTWNEKLSSVLRRAESFA